MSHLIPSSAMPRSRFSDWTAAVASATTTVAAKTAHRIVSIARRPSVEGFRRAAGFADRARGFAALAIAGLERLREDWQRPSRDPRRGG
jgi:hypothetical protein